MKLTYKQISRKEIDKNCKKYCESYATCSKTRKECKRCLGWAQESHTLIMMNIGDSLYLTYKMRKERWQEPQETRVNTVLR